MSFHKCQTATAQADCSILNEESFHFPSEASLCGYTEDAQREHARPTGGGNRQEINTEPDYYYFFCC